MKKLRFIFVFLCTTILLSCREKARDPLLLSDLSQSSFILGEPFSECYALAEKDTNITMLARKWYGKHQRQDSLFSYAYFRTSRRLTDLLSVQIDVTVEGFRDTVAQISYEPCYYRSANYDSYRSRHDAERIISWYRDKYGKEILKKGPSYKYHDNHLKHISLDHRWLFSNAGIWIEENEHYMIPFSDQRVFDGIRVNCYHMKMLLEILGYMDATEDFID